MLQPLKRREQKAERKRGSADAVTPARSGLHPRLEGFDELLGFGKGSRCARGRARSLGPTCKCTQPIIELAWTMGRVEKWGRSEWSSRRSSSAAQGAMALLTSLEAGEEDTEHMYSTNTPRLHAEQYMRRQDFLSDRRWSFGGEGEGGARDVKLTIPLAIRCSWPSTVPTSERSRETS